MPTTASAGAQNRLTQLLHLRAREDLNIDTRTATEYGVVRTFFDAVFTWTTGRIPATAPAAAHRLGSAGARARDNAPTAHSGGTLGVYYAFIQFAGFTMGKAVSQFDAPWTNYPGNNFDGLVGGGGTVTGVNQFTYTAEFGNGVSRRRSRRRIRRPTISRQPVQPGAGATRRPALFGRRLSASTPRRHAGS